MTLAMLSWGAHRTLKNTLESYETFGVKEKENIIWFQEITNEDKRIADKYGFKYYGTSENIGIANAYRELVNLATEDTFLFLENDWMAIETGEYLNAGRELLYEGTVDVVRYRHRKYPGHPLWTRQFAGTEHERPTHLLDSIHWTDPSRFQEITYEHPFYITSAKYANWTNNPTMFKTEFLRERVLPHMGHRDIEVDLQEWWEQQGDIEVAQHEIGIFTHKRIG